MYRIGTLRARVKIMVRNMTCYRSTTNCDRNILNKYWLSLMLLQSKVSTTPHSTLYNIYFIKFMFQKGKKRITHGDTRAVAHRVRVRTYIHHCLSGIEMRLPSSVRPEY